MKKLYLMRHAKSSWSDSSLDDVDRPLNSRGKRDALRMGEYLNHLGKLPAVVVSSPAKRARKTAQRFIKASGFSGPFEINPDLYGAAITDYVHVLNQQLDHHPSILVIGHNPTMEDLLSYLTGTWLDLKTATIAELEIEIERWSDLAPRSSSTLQNLWYPKEINLH